MQEPAIKLKEVIWEITDVCKTGCEYCGSKDILNKICPSDTDIKQIAKSICSYPPEEINISGGDPLTVSTETMRYVTDILKANCKKVKVLVNPLSIEKDISRADSILDMFDWVGISVNTERELNTLIKIWPFIYAREKCTIITNFNCENSWIYDLFETFVKDNNLMWQIQYTMYKGKHINAIYDRPLGIDYLHKNIQKSMNNGVKIIVADNMNTGKCSAGTYSCGILANGDVVPCLSMRSWTDGAYSLGNIKDNYFVDVWTRGFAEFRCNAFKCCKDVCNAPYNLMSIKLPTITTDSIKYDPNKTVYVYGVYNEPWDKNWNEIVMAYAVQSQPITMLYGVSPIIGGSGSSITTTGYTSQVETK